MPLLIVVSEKFKQSKKKNSLNRYQCSKCHLERLHNLVLEDIRTEKSRLQGIQMYLCAGDGQGQTTMCCKTSNYK